MVPVWRELLYKRKHIQICIDMYLVTESVFTHMPDKSNFGEIGSNPAQNAPQGKMNRSS